MPKFQLPAAVRRSVRGAAKSALRKVRTNVDTNMKKEKMRTRSMKRRGGRVARMGMKGQGTRRVSPKPNV